MPLLLTRQNGPHTVSQLGIYSVLLLYPQSILKKCGAELNSITQSTYDFLNREACEFIESDLFYCLS